MMKYVVSMILLIILFIALTGCVNSTGDSATSSTISPNIDQSCFKFSDDRVVEDRWVGNGCVWYEIVGNVTNICTKNFQYVKVKTKFFDKENVLTGSKIDTINIIQHGTTVPFGAYYCAGSGMNNATRYELGIDGYRLQS